MSRNTFLTRFTLYLILWSILLLVIVFWKPLFSSETLFHPDWAPYFEAGTGHGFWRIFVEIGRVPSFMYFMWALLPDSLFHVLFYPVGTFAIWAVLYVVLRSRSLPRAAAMAGALAGAFSGYLLTLVSAGHRGVTEAMLSSVIILLCVDRVVRGGSIWFGIAGALATAFTLGTQPDVLGVIGMFLAAYALMAIWNNRETIGANKQRFGLTVLVAAVVFAVTVLPAVHKIRESFLPGREAQITQSVAGGDTEASDAERWEFVTNWSLPLADTPEFILPLFFGTETTDREAPFWGELGRSLGWEPGHPGFRNFRQHSVYIGILQVLLAFFALGCLLSKRCRQMLFASDDEKRQIIFWGICAIIALFLSFGRYTPFYRLFYALPLANAIRAPIKFLHVVNLAIAILTAYGVTFLLRSLDEEKDRREMRALAQSAAKWLAIGAGGLAVFLALVAVVVWSASTSIAASWSQMGFDASLHPAMRHHMFTALWRSIGLAAGLAGCIYFFILRRKPPVWSATALGVVLCGAIGLDMAVTARQFVNTADISVHESSNAIVDDIRGEPPPRVFDMLTSRQMHDPLRVNFERYHAASVRVLDAELSKYPRLLTAVGNDFGRLIRMLQVTGTAYVIGRKEQLEPWLQSDAFSLAGTYDFANRIIRSHSARQGRILLLRVSEPLPRAAWMLAVREVGESEMAKAIFAAAFDPRRELLVDEDAADWGSSVPGPNATFLTAIIRDWSRWRVAVDTVPAAGGVLLLNEPYHRDWKAYADDQPIAIALANGAMMAVSVPEGAQEVLFLRQPGLRFFWISSIPATILFALLLTRVLLWCVRKASIKDISS